MVEAGAEAVGAEVEAAVAVEVEVAEVAEVAAEATRTSASRCPGAP